MLFARQRDLPFTQVTRSSGMPDVGTATRLRRRSRPAQGVIVLDSRSRHSSAALSRAALSRAAHSPGALRDLGPAAVAVVPLADAERVVVAGASFARKRIEHAIELFGACMFIALAVAMALFA